MAVGWLADDCAFTMKFQSGECTRASVSGMRYQFCINKTMGLVFYAIPLTRDNKDDTRLSQNIRLQFGGKSMATRLRGCKSTRRKFSSLERDTIERDFGWTMIEYSRAMIAKRVTLTDQVYKFTRLISLNWSIETNRQRPILYLSGIRRA